MLKIQKMPKNYFPDLLSIYENAIFVRNTQVNQKGNRLEKF
jgi:hypothetical protein